jgi:hypothetical protein
MEDKKPYEKPEIIHELNLETRAGSTLTPPFDPTNPLGVDLGESS